MEKAQRISKTLLYFFSRLALGKPLGEGAFGIVIKSFAQGMSGKNGRTPVALKMLKGKLHSVVRYYKASEVLCSYHGWI